jgi:hypothetical protein
MHRQMKNYRKLHEFASNHHVTSNSTHSDILILKDVSKQFELLSLPNTIQRILGLRKSTEDLKTGI